MSLTVEDRLRIGELLARYAHVVDNKDWTALRELFTNDAIVDLTSYGVSSRVGIEDVMDFYIHAKHPLQHYGESIEIWREEPPTRVRSKWLVVYPGGRLSGGDYIDQVRKERDQWRLASRAVIRRWTSGQRSHSDQDVPS